MSQSLLSRIALVPGCVALGLWGIRSSAAEQPTADTSSQVRPVNYARDIKPLLSGRCYICHGPDEGQRQGGLRLDERETAVAKAIVPGDAAGSLLMERVTSPAPEQVMPPADSNVPPLTADEVALLRRWIDEGATFEVHWSYVPPRKPAVPAAGDEGWARGPIDQFVAAAHAEQGLRPAPPADAITLVRRLSFDLTGLPPTWQQADEFAADPSDTAYERLVDQLLASPHYGERMAMYWLDLVRYADTTGIHGDNHRDIAPYRDYVIAAFNDNKPFDRFTIEQLAGDLLPGATMLDRIASGYNKLLMTTTEGGAQAKEYTAKYAADRVRNASSVWLGSTLGCAECHDHKYDPFTTKDFYRFAAFFADVNEIPVGLPEQTPVLFEAEAAEVARLEADLTSLRHQLDTTTPEIAASQAGWEQRTRAEIAAQRAAWTVVRPTAVQSDGAASFALADDDSALAGDPSPANDSYTVTLDTNLERITGIRLEALRHPTLADGGLSRAGNIVLTGLEVAVRSLDNLEPQRVAIASAAADYAQQGFPIEAAIDDKADTGWAVDGHVRKEDRMAVFTFAEPIAGGPGTTLTVRLLHQSQYAQHNIGRFRLALTTLEKPQLPQGSLPADIATAVETEAGARTPEQSAALAAHYRGIAPELEPVRQRAAAVEKDRQTRIDRAPKTLVSMSVEPRMVRVLPRGNWLDDNGEVVAPATPAFLPQLAVSDRRPTRLDLANWLIESRNPLVARVFVNRLWKLAFGRGIVRTMEDYGSQGSGPTHPELLDWLAIDFVEHGWDVKRALKQMVMSAAYRQSSRCEPDVRERDPQNLWLARQARFRLDAEMIRDNALAVSGLLVRKVGGASAKPYQPPGYWAHLNFPTREYQADTGEGLYRRGLYTYWCRTFLHPSLLAFDAPTREECTVERPRSSTPLQALVLLNDPTYVEAARVLAERTIRDGGADEAARLEWICRRVLSRGIRPAERETLARLLARHAAEYADDQEAARQLVSTGAAPVPDDLNAAELAAWTSVARVVLNLHETITRN
jgi:hypothetical protein